MSSTVDWAVLLMLLLMMTLGFYAMWDSRQVYRAASLDAYAEYKPKLAQPTKSFESLQDINADIIAWLTVTDTGIDYPVAQYTDNNKYVFTSAMGSYAPSGCPFLDYQNKSDFSDLVNIIYGHHMAQGAMFGDLEKFKGQHYFEKHSQGILHVGGQTYGLFFFAFLQVDSYDNAIYNPTTNNLEVYIETLQQKSMWYRNTNVSTTDHFILLSTCTSDITNGRHILVGRITDTTSQSENVDSTATVSFWQDLLNEMTKIKWWEWFSLIGLLCICVVGLWYAHKRKEHRKHETENKR
ncbi:class B sortase [Eubacterium aggregans]|uniref:class B sortase n=1 Tax=Eubacterium aggregans TaxID=81409 RepID=UPI003F3AA39B